MALVLLNITYFGLYAILYPYLPVLTHKLGYTPALTGVLMGLFEAAGITGPFIFGFLADKWGLYKKPLLIAVLLAVLPVMPLVLIRNPLLSALFIVFIAVGLRSYQPLLDAITTIYVGPNGNYGRIRVSGSIGYIGAMLFFQVTPFLYPDRAFNIGAWTVICGTICFLTTLLFFRDAGFRGGAGKSPASPRGDTAGFGTRWGYAFIPGIIMIALSRFSYAPVNFLGLYVPEALHWNAVGIVFATASLTEIPVMFLAKRIIRRFGALPLLALGSFFTGVRVLLYALVPSPGGVIAGQLLHFVSYGIFHNAAIAFVSSHVPPARRALGITIYLSLGTGLPAFAGNILAGFIIGLAGWKNLFLVYGCCSVLPLALYACMRRLDRH
jgi:PPP family 3-phenylpropionic acid transporter